MLKIQFTEELKEKVPAVHLFCIACDVESGVTSDCLWNLLAEKCTELRSSLKVEEISSLPAIKASRAAYKACGKDPARYRLSAEALLRRIVKGEDLYRIGNLVDIINLVSISSGFSIGGYDADKIQGNVGFGIGKSGEPYTGIGRGELNIEGLPVFRDDLGAFGSPTSDSERTSVNLNTHRFMMVIIDLGTPGLLQATGDNAINLLIEFANARNLEIKRI